MYAPYYYIPSYCNFSIKGSVDPYANQNVGGAHPAAVASAVAAAAGHPAQEWTVAPQAQVRTQILCPSGLAEPFLQQYQGNPGYAPLHEVVDPPQVQMDMAPNEGALDLSAPERLRRLAERYVSNPDSTVNGVHLESGPYGRLQVVITIDIGDILGDTNN